MGSCKETRVSLINVTALAVWAETLYTSWRPWTYLLNGAGVGGGWKAHRQAL